MKQQFGILMMSVLIIMLIACGGGGGGNMPIPPTNAATRQTSLDDTSEEFTGEKITVAVFDFENNTSGARKEELAGLQKGLTDMFITELTMIKEFTVVERTRLETVANELALPDLVGVDSETAQTVGRLLGAQVIYLGGYFEIVGQFSLSARLIRTETGEVMTSTSPRIKYDPDKILDLVGKVSKDLTKAIKQKRNVLLADIYFSRGRTVEGEEEDIDKAIELYKKALEYHPQNSNSLKAIERLQGEQ